MKTQYANDLGITLQNIPTEQSTIVGDDLNGYVGTKREEYERKLKENEYGNKTEEREQVIQTALT